MPSTWDTSSDYDTIELHLEDPKKVPITLKAGTTYNLQYYILISSNLGYDWIEMLLKYL
jgi:hypothetical protein